MEELHESPSNRNFTMISRKLYALFIQYIEGGRIRAPPEADLIFLISTFQSGAKTDRRALQSKFKSWAKRMIVDNHVLKLICTGKEIIPEEESCKIVMRSHFQGHLSVDLVIKQIQEKYTWTKKNFGMDRKMVVDSILKNCNNLDCIRAIENNEAVRNYQCEDFIKDVILSSESRMYNQQNLLQQSLAKITNPSSLYGFPIGYPLTSCAIDNSFQRDLKGSNVKNMNPLFDDSTKLTLPKGSSGMVEPTNNLKMLSDSVPSEKSKKLNLEKSLKVLPRSFRKPKNTLELKSLLNAAEQFKNYPAVLCNPKTKFLGSFGLAPKRICSKRTLSKVEREKKRNKAQNLQNMRYHQNRKHLRDRNKLNKIKLKEQLERRAYLDKFERSAEGGSQKVVSKGFFDTVQRGLNLVIDSCGESNNAASSADESEVEIVKVVSKNGKPEVIEIDSSSDEENNLTSSISKHKDVSNDFTISVNGDERKISMISNFDGTETHNSQVSDIGGHPQHNQQLKKTPNTAGFTSSMVQPAAQIRYYPIFKQPYILPSNSKSEVAILPSPCSSIVSSNKDKPDCSGFVNSHATKPVKVTKAAMLGKKPILRPIPSVNKINLQKLPTPGITSKIPDGTSICLIREQPSGIIEMVPYKRVVATNIVSHCSKETCKEDRPISVEPIKSKYRSIRPAPAKDLEISRQRALDANKHFLDEEMTKLSKWIGGMKSTMSRTYFQLNVQRSKHRLESQLNAAIGLVKSIRRKLWEIEKLEGQVNNYNFHKDTKNVM